MNLRLSLLVLLMVNLLGLAGCSRWTDIQAPTTVAPSSEFPITVTEAYGVDTGGSLPLGEPVGLVYSVVIPLDWTAPAEAAYEGVWNSIPVSLTANKMAGPPDSDLVAFIEQQNEGETLSPEEEAIATALDCEASPPEVPSGSQRVWYQIGPPTPSGTIAAGDTGTLTVQLQSGPNSKPATVSFQHAYYIDFSLVEEEIDPNDPVPPNICVWSFDPAGAGGDPNDLDLENIADRISADINFMGLEVPIPIFGGGMLALLAAMMALIGVWVGRSKL